MTKITLLDDRDRSGQLLNQTYYKRLNYSRVINREHTTGRQVSSETVGFLLARRQRLLAIGCWLLAEASSNLRVVSD